jgi:hypothetical protein
MNQGIGVAVALDTFHLVAAPMVAATLVAAILVAAILVAAILVAAILVAAILVATLVPSMETTMEIAVYPHLHMNMNMDMANSDTLRHYQHKLGNPLCSSDNLSTYTCTSFLFHFFQFTLSCYMRLSANVPG